MDFSTPIKNNPLNKIIGLSVILLTGFLLVVLAGVYGNWYPIINGIICAVAHLPVAVTKALSSDDFSFDPGAATHTSALKESGQFVSAFLVLTGVALPILLHHSLILTKAAMVLTIVGGALIYGTVYTFATYFEEPEEDVDLAGGVI